MKATFTLFPLLSFLFAQTVSVENEEMQYKDILNYNTDTFNSEVAIRPHFVMFSIPWCKICQELAPVWDKLSKKYNKDNSHLGIILAKVDCTTEEELCRKMKIDTHPKLKFYGDHLQDLNGESIEFHGKYTRNELEYFLRENLKTIHQDGRSSPRTPKSKSTAPKSSVIVLTTRNFEKEVRKGLTFIKFYSPSCGFCTEMADTWIELAKKFANSPIKIAKINCQTEKSVCEQHGVWGYPGLWLWKNGNPKKEFMNDRTMREFQKFVNEHLPKDEL